MKILIHSNAPWMPSGYGRQAALAGRILTDHGHDVSYSAFAGLGGAPIKWNDCAVYPSGQFPFSPDTIVRHAQSAQADLVISMMDSYKLAPAAAELSVMPVPFCPFIIADCRAENGGPSIPDQQLIAASSALPVAVSGFGHALLEAITGIYPVNWEPAYVPHAVDVTVFKPPADRLALREEMGTADLFVIGICAANRDGVRKGFAEQFSAFAQFSARHDDARLAVFSVLDSVNGLPLAEMANDFGILPKTLFMPGYEQVAGLLGDDFMSQWYGSLDVLSNAGYAEGFGVCLLEAQACGTPVVATDCSAMTELTGEAGWLVDGDLYWNAVLRGWWVRPRENAIVNAWEQAYKERGDENRRNRAVAFAQRYGLDEAGHHWGDFIHDVLDWKDEQS